MPDKSEAITLQIDGMTCANCALGIARALEKNGASGVHINYSTGEAVFSLAAPDKLKFLVESVNSLGYKVLARFQEQKLTIIKKLSADAPNPMVGNGINDAPALAQATTGISIRNASPVAIQSAQIILRNTKNLKQLEFADKISRHTLLTIKQNLFRAFFYNMVAIPLAAFGFLSPMVRALAMVCSDVMVIGNSIRLKYKKID